MGRVYVPSDGHYDRLLVPLKIYNCYFWAHNPDLKRPQWVKDEIDQFCCKHRETIIHCELTTNIYQEGFFVGTKEWMFHESQKDIRRKCQKVCCFHDEGVREKKVLDKKKYEKRRQLGLAL